MRDFATPGVIAFALSMPAIDFTDAGDAALVALIKRAIEEDRFPRAPRLDPLRTALAKLYRQRRRRKGGRWPPKARNPQKQPAALLRPPPRRGQDAPMWREAFRTDILFRA